MPGMVPFTPSNSEALHSTQSAMKILVSPG